MVKFFFQNGPIIKKTPSTPECEEVLAELRKKYYNPREGTSKQQYVEATTFPIVSIDENL